MPRLKLKWCFELAFSAGLVSLFIFVISHLHQLAWPDEPTNSSTPIALKVPGQETFCPPFQRDAGFADRINFVDGTGEQCLLLRSVCGVESAARTNPQMTVYVYMNSEVQQWPAPGSRGAKVTRRPRPGKARSCQVMDVLQSYPNVQVIRQNLEKSLLYEERWDTVFDDPNRWADDVLTDAVKLQLTKLYGGVTLDSNIINFRPLHCLGNSLVSLPGEGQLASELLSFEPKNPFVSYLIRSAIYHNSNKDRQSLGREAFTRAFREYCKTDNITVGSHLCYNNNRLQVMDPSALFPVEPAHWIHLFLQSFDKSQVSAFSRSFLAHVRSSGWGLLVAESSLYSSLARYYCPATWAAAARASLAQYF